MMSDEELDNVAGGTFDENEELQDAIGKVREIDGFISGVPGKINTYVPKSDLDDYLKKYYNIDANTHGQWGIGSGAPIEEEDVPNTYSLNGKSITHQEVLNIIKSKK